MPQDNPRSEGQRSENPRPDSARFDQGRGGKPPAAEVPRFAEIGVKNVKAGLRMHKEMFDTLQGIGQDWLVRATSEAELVCRLPNRLTNARSVSDMMSTYQEWLGEWLSMRGEDSKRLLSDGKKIVDTGVRCFAGVSAAAPS